jgi:hypothetical protein
MKKTFTFLFLVLLLALSAVPALAADQNPPMPPARFVMWGSVTALDATNHTISVHVLIYRGTRGAPPTSATLRVNDRTHFALHTDTGNVPGAFSDVAVGQILMINGVHAQGNFYAQTVLINAPMPPQMFAIGGAVTALDATAKTITLTVVHAMPPALGIQPGDSVVITANANTRFCAASQGHPCTPIAFGDLAVHDHVITNGAVVNGAFMARDVTRLPAPPQ